MPAGCWRTTWILFWKAPSSPTRHSAPMQLTRTTSEGNWSSLVEPLCLPVVGEPHGSIRRTPRTERRRVWWQTVDRCSGQKASVSPTFFDALLGPNNSYPRHLVQTEATWLSKFRTPTSPPSFMVSPTTKSRGRITELPWPNSLFLRVRIRSNGK